MATIEQIIEKMKELTKTHTNEEAATMTAQQLNESLDKVCDTWWYYLSKT